MVDLQEMEEKLLSKDVKDNGASIINAGFFSRLLAFFIDYTILMFSALLILVLLAITGFISLESSFGIFWNRTQIYENIPFLALFASRMSILVHISYSLYFIFYFVLFESKYIWGATPGKRLMKLSVVDSKGDSLTLKDSFIRNSTKYLLRPPIIGIPFGLLELLLVMFFSKRTGDMLADTFVAEDVHKGKYYKDED
ncbi:MAG: RDD family protein [Candidatus Saliniplasma sp.]